MSRTNTEFQLTGSNVRDENAIPIRTAGLNTFVNGAVSVTNTPTELKAGVTRLDGRKQIVIYPPSAGTIYWGTSTVTSANGAPLSAGSNPISFDFNPDQVVSIYAVNDGTNRDVRVVESK